MLSFLAYGVIVVIVAAVMVTLAVDQIKVLKNTRKPMAVRNNR